LCSASTARDLLGAEHLRQFALFSGEIVIKCLLPYVRFEKSLVCNFSYNLTLYMWWTMRLELIIVGFVVGIVLGQRCNAWILMPAVMLAMMFGTMVGIARADSFWSIVLTTVAGVIAVQLGYLTGVVINSVIILIFPPRKGERDPSQNLDMRPIWPLLDIRRYRDSPGRGPAAIVASDCMEVRLDEVWRNLPWS
jgi:hypothetical protein